MPTYPYACTACEHRFEIVQAFSDDALTECPACGGRLRKVFSSVGVVFKGSGFYRNDSRADGGSKPSSGSGSDAPSTSDAPASSDPGSGSGTTSAPVTKEPAAAPAAAKRSDPAPKSTPKAPERAKGSGSAA